MHAAPDTAPQPDRGRAPWWRHRVGAGIGRCGAIAPTVRDKGRVLRIPHAIGARRRGSGGVLVVPYPRSTRMPAHRPPLCGRGFAPRARDADAKAPGRTVLTRSSIGCDSPSWTPVLCYASPSTLGFIGFIASIRPRRCSMPHTAAVVRTDLPLLTLVRMPRRAPPPPPSFRVPARRCRLARASIGSRVTVIPVLGTVRAPLPAASSPADRPCLDAQAVKTLGAGDIVEECIRGLPTTPWKVSGTDLVPARRFLTLRAADAEAHVVWWAHRWDEMRETSLDPIPHNAWKWLAAHLPGHPEPLTGHLAMVRIAQVRECMNARITSASPRPAVMRRRAEPRETPAAFAGGSKRTSDHRLIHSLPICPAGHCSRPRPTRFGGRLANVSANRMGSFA